jgi:hypothetical protein
MFTNSKHVLVFKFEKTRKMLETDSSSFAVQVSASERLDYGASSILFACSPSDVDVKARGKLAVKDFSCQNLLRKR